MSHIAIVRRARLAAAILAVASAAPVLAQEHPIEKLPGDMIYCVAVRDAGELRERWKASRFGDAWESPEFAKMRGYVEGEWKEFAADFEEKSHVSPEALFSHLDGFAAFFTTHAATRTVGDEVLSEYDICFVAEVPEAKREEVQQTIDKLLSDVPSTATKSLEEVAGTTIHVVKYVEETPVQGSPSDPNAPVLNDQTTTTIQYAFAGDMLVLAEGPNEPAKKIVSSLSTDTVPRLGANAAFRKLAERNKGLGSATAWINVPRILEVGRSGVDGEEATKYFAALGIDELGPALVTADLDDQGVLSRAAAIMPANRRGIVAMLYAGEPNPVQSAARVPADARGYYSWTLDLETLWSHLSQLIKTMNPQADGMVTMGMMTVQANYGINLQTDVIAKISGEHAFYQRPDPAAPSTAVDGSPTIAAPTTGLLLGLRGGAETAAGLNAIFEKLGKPPADGSMATGMSFDNENVDGTTVWSLPADMVPPGEQSPAWAFTPAFAAIGSGKAELRQVLRQAAGQDAASLAAQPDFRAALEGAPKENLRLFAYTSPDSYATMVDTLRVMLANMGMMDSTITIAPEDVPPLEWWKRHFGATVSAVSLDSEMLTADYRLKTVPKQ